MSSRQLQSAEARSTRSSLDVHACVASEQTARLHRLVSRGPGAESIAQALSCSDPEPGCHWTPQTAQSSCWSVAGPARQPVIQLHSETARRSTHVGWNVIQRLGRSVAVLEALVAVVTVLWRSTVAAASAVPQPVAPQVEAVDIGHTWTTSSAQYTRRSCPGHIYGIALELTQHIAHLFIHPSSTMLACLHSCMLTLVHGAQI